MVGGAGLLGRDQKGCYGRKRLRNAVLSNDGHPLHEVNPSNFSNISDAYMTMQFTKLSLFK